MIDEKLRARLQKLQAMAADATSENEAMIAARRLQALLAKHGMKEIELGSTNGNEVTTDQFTVDRKTGGGWWSKVIAKNVAELNFCQIFIQSAGGTAHHVFVVGSEAYRTSAVKVTESVIRAVDREARLASKTQRPQGVDGWAYITSFRNSAAQRVAERCRELIASAREGTLQDEEGGTLPVLAPLYDQQMRRIEDYLAGMNLLRDKTRTRNSSASGAKAGRRFGDRVQLGRELKNHAPKGIEQK